jgi:hypothetical protein
VGLFPAAENLTSANAEKAQSDLEYVDNFIDCCSLNFEPHGEMLKSGLS